jgi:hypothetical protein
MTIKVGDIVEDISRGDLPFMVIKIERELRDDIPGRYTIESIEGERIKNFPGYQLKPARPANESRFGK